MNPGPTAVCSKSMTRLQNLHGDGRAGRRIIAAIEEYWKVAYV